jgi:ABC-2 type transport system ATP-binding protein
MRVSTDYDRPEENVHTNEYPAIELRGLTRDYGSLRALDDVSLSVYRGEVFGFLGPNGAGKSTAIRILFDLIRPTAGSARVLGIDCQRDSVPARTRMGYLPGELNLYDNLTGRQTINYFASLRKLPAGDAFAGALIDRLGLDPTRVVGSYSKGNRQKLGLILAMMHQPDVLVLDEPTSGLDPLVQEEVASLLGEFATEGRTIFFSSHVLSEVERMCHRVAFLRGGKLVAMENVGALRGRSLHVIQVTFAEPAPAADFALEGVRVVEVHGSTMHLEVRDNLDAALKAIGRHTVVDLRTEQPSLEQVFRVYYEEAGLIDTAEAEHAAS